jgi:hypothetical protein
MMRDYLASCEIHALLHFLHAENISEAEIHRELCATVYGQYVTSEGTVRQRRRMFTVGEKMFTIKSEVVGQPSVMSDDIVQNERRRFTISELSSKFLTNFTHCSLRDYHS